MQLSCLLASKFVYIISRKFSRVANTLTISVMEQSCLSYDPKSVKKRCLSDGVLSLSLIYLNALTSVYITVMHLEGGMKCVLQCSCFIMRMERKLRRMRLEFRSLGVSKL